MNRLNLIWRLVGGNIILILFAIFTANSNNENAQYFILTNGLIVAFTFINIVRRKLNMWSDFKDILIVYIACVTAVNLCYINTSYQCVLALLSSVVSSLWIVKFLMLKKTKNIN